MKTILVTGGSGFIGSAFIRRFIKKTKKIINLDLLTYAAMKDPVSEERNYQFIQGDIQDQKQVESILATDVDTVVHFAAETHVDRSIESCAPFVRANVLGTLSLLEAVRKYPQVHFHHVSTDEVYGSLGDTGAFTEQSNYAPNSPYAASKGASDLFVRAFAKTYGIKTTLSHCSNNYGPGQYPEKLIPLVISRCRSKQPIPLYGEGKNVRDWLYVDDHVDAIWEILEGGEIGETYDIGGGTELTNRELLYLLTDLLQERTGEEYRSLITEVNDRPGHDYRYAIDAKKIKKELGWFPKTSLENGLHQTIDYQLSRPI